MQEIGFNLILYNLATVDIQTVDVTLWTALIQTKLQLNGQCYTFNVTVINLKYKIGNIQLYVLCNTHTHHNTPL